MGVGACWWLLAIGGCCCCLLVFLAWVCLGLLGCRYSGRLRYVYDFLWVVFTVFMLNSVVLAFLLFEVRCFVVRYTFDVVCYTVAVRLLCCLWLSL